MIRKAKRIYRSIVRAGVYNGLGRLLNYYLCYSDTRKRLPFFCRTTPVHLQVEVSKICNLNCIMCEYPLQKAKGVSMRFADFVRCLNRFPRIHSLDLTGIGEPFCNPDFMDILGFALRKGVRVEFTSNGNLLNEHYINELIRLELDSVSFSIDAATRTTYERIRQGGDFDRLKANLALFSARVGRSRKKKPEIHLNYTVSRDNIKEVPLFPEFAKDAGVNKIFYRDLIVFNSGNYSEADKVDTLDSTILSEIKEKTLQTSRRLGIAALFCDSFSPAATGKLCYRPWLSSFVDVFGNFYPCCHVLQRNADISRFSLGNMFKDDLKSLWNSKGYQALRKGIKEPGVTPPLCKGCNCLRK